MCVCVVGGGGVGGGGGGGAREGRGLHIQYGKCPKKSNTLFHTCFGLNFDFHTVIKILKWGGKRCRS